MSVISPAEFLKDLDVEFLKRYRPSSGMNSAPVEYVEPNLSSDPTRSKSTSVPTLEPRYGGATSSKTLNKITSKIVTLGNFIDTDAVRCHRS